MNRMIIRVCEIALAALTQVQMDAKEKYSKESREIAESGNNTACAIREADSGFKRVYDLAEERKTEVKQLMDIAYRKDI